MSASFLQSCYERATAKRNGAKLQSNVLKSLIRYIQSIHVHMYVYLIFYLFVYMDLFLWVEERLPMIVENSHKANERERSKFTKHVYGLARAYTFAV